jgi:hypothetical protein
MIDQMIIKLLQLIWDLRILVHGSPYNVTFIVMHNNVLNFFLFYVT